MNAGANLGIDRVRGTERIAALDVLRGIAILFILYLNIPGMGGYDFQLESVVNQMLGEEFKADTNTRWPKRARARIS